MINNATIYMCQLNGNHLQYHVVNQHQGILYCQSKRAIQISCIDLSSSTLHQQNEQIFQDLG